MIMLIMLILENKYTLILFIIHRCVELLTTFCKAKWWLHACIIQICHINIDISIIICCRRILEFCCTGVVDTDVHYQNIYHTITSTTQLYNTRLELLMKEIYFLPVTKTKKIICIIN